MTAKGYFFDFDGTLVDSMDPAIDALLGFLRERGVRYPENIVEIMLPLGYKGIASYFSDAFGIDGTPEKIYAELIDRLTRVYAYTVGGNLGVGPVLHRLKKQGAKLYVLTGSPKEFFLPCLQRLGWYSLFDGCWSVADFGLTKADPELFRTVADTVGLPCAECVMVDDSMQSLRTARSVGMKTVGVYDKYSRQDETKMRSFVDQYIYDFTQF